MKQKICRYPNGSIKYIVNRNNSGQRHGLYVGYYSDGSIWRIRNWINDKRFGIQTNNYYNGKIEQKYYL